MLAPLAASCAADASKPVNQHDSYAVEARCESWQAKWIGSAKGREEGWPVIYARTSFDLERIPRSAVIHISAHLLFKLYVNGQFLGEGPPRSKPPRISYCSFQARSALHSGVNVIVIETFSAPPRKPAALIAQLECRDERGEIMTRVATEESWKVIPAPWERIAAHSAGFDAQPEIFNAGREPVARHKPEFDDRKWEPALVLQEKELPFKTIEPSILPHYRRTMVPPLGINLEGEVLQIMGDTQRSAGLAMAVEIPRPLDRCRIANAGGLLAGGKGAATIEPEFPVNDQKSYYTYWANHDDMPAVRCPTLILDFGELMNAYVTLDLEGRGGEVVDMAWGQTLIEGRVLPVLYSRGEPDAEGKPNNLLANRYVLRQGRQQWETWHWQSFRYLQLTFRRLDGPLKLHRVVAVKSEQPLTERGRFRCSDPFLDKLFAATGKTLRLASYDTFMDNTIREKSIWGGDISDGSVSSCLAVFGDVPMLRHYMDLFCKTQDDTGMISNNGVGGTKSPWFSHPLRTGIWMAEYGLWCAETHHYRATVLPVLERYLDCLHARSHERGLLKLEGLENDWVDHVTGRAPSDIPVPVNLFHAILLGRAARTFAAYGREDLANDCRDRARRIGESVRRDFWSAEQGLYVDGTLKGRPCGSFSEHANYLALLCGLGLDGRQPRILQHLRDPQHVGEIVQANAPFMFWPPAALFFIGEDLAALDMLRTRYARFFVHGDETFWGEWSWLIGGNGWNSRYRSLAQNGAGSPAWFLLTEVLGVKPTAAGFVTFEIVPHPGDLVWAEGVVPSPKGDIPVKWRRDGDQFTIEVTVPKGTSATVRLPGSEKKTVLRPGSHVLNNERK